MGDLDVRERRGECLGFLQEGAAADWPAVDSAFSRAYGFLPSAAVSRGSSAGTSS